MKVDKTERGFGIVHFVDRYDQECSLQKSSLATEDAVWLGVDTATPEILIPNKGWCPVEFPEGTFFHTRMHITQDQMKELLPYLIEFAKTGEI